MITLRKLNMSSPEKGTTFEKKITKQIEVIMLQISIIEVVECSQVVNMCCMSVWTLVPTELGLSTKFFFQNLFPPLK